MLPPRILAALIGLITLSACFYSEVPLIPPGEQVTLPYNGVVLCLAFDCRIVMAGEDGVYEIAPPEDEEGEPLFVRFQVLVANEGNPVYLAEAEMRDDGDPKVSYQYLVAHQRVRAATHVPTYEFAMPSCNDAPDGTLEAFGIEREDSYACRVTDLDAFKQYLIEVHSADFESEAFWKED
ncbi:hypothetical protein [Hyphomonas sp.]|jgi:hypothetical protein|uniref:hypothetical protein n=1 Tax=Hyphomonas sp. TaxID=87 RepID=UPI0039E56631